MLSEHAQLLPSALTYSHALDKHTKMHHLNTSESSPFYATHPKYRLDLAVWHFPGDIFSHSSVAHLMLTILWNSCLCVRKCVCVFQTYIPRYVPFESFSVEVNFLSFVWILTAAPLMPVAEHLLSGWNTHFQTHAFNNVLAIEFPLHLKSTPSFFRFWIPLFTRFYISFDVFLLLLWSPVVRQMTFSSGCVCSRIDTFSFLSHFLFILNSVQASHVPYILEKKNRKM